MYSGNGPIQGRARIRRVEETVVRAVADLPFRLQAANGIERLDMRLHQVAQNLQGEHYIMFARRIGPSRYPMTA